MQLSTRGQIQMGEIIAVIVVFIMLLIFGLFWFFQQGTSQAGEIQEEQFRLQLLERTKEIMNLPELQCSFASTPDTSCVDLYKMQAIQDVINYNIDIRRQFEDRFFGQAVRIDVVYPATHTLPLQTVLFNFSTSSDSYQSAVVPVTIRDPITRRSYFGALILQNYQMS